MGGGGSLKSRREEQNQLICDSDKGVKKSENFADVIFGSPHTPKCLNMPKGSDAHCERICDPLAKSLFVGRESVRA